MDIVKNTYETMSRVVKERGGLRSDCVSVEIGLPGSDRNSTVQRGPAVHFCASSYNVDLVKTIKAGSK